MAALKPSPWPDSLPIDAPERRRLPVLLRRAWYSLNQSFRRRIAHLGLTPDQFTVLRTLSEAKPQEFPQRELTELMSSDPNTIASLLERMETAGWLVRHRDEKDRRAYRISLKPAGKEKYRSAREIAVELQKNVLQSLPEHRREEFLEDLAKVADSCHSVAETHETKVSTKPSGPKSE